MSNGILCSSAAGGKENSMYFDATEFAARLSTLRKAQGMTQEEMAEALNISLEHLSKMERGKRKPSIDLIIAMACYFHVSTDYLLMGKDHDMVDSRTKLLDVVTQLTEIAKSLYGEEPCHVCHGSKIRSEETRDLGCAYSLSRPRGM